MSNMFLIQEVSNISSICTLDSYKTIVKLIGVLMQWICVFVPIVIIIFGVKDLYSVIAGKGTDETLNKSIKSIYVQCLAISHIVEYLYSVFFIRFFILFGNIIA